MRQPPEAYPHRCRAGGISFYADDADLVEAELDGRLATEDLEHDLDLAGLGVDLGNEAVEVGQGPERTRTGLAQLKTLVGALGDAVALLGLRA